MVSENRPDISVAWYDSVGEEWIDIRSYCKDFRVRDSGVLKLSQAEVTLQNRGGIFSDGVNMIPKFSHFRIKGNVRGVWDDIFFGRFFGYKGGHTRRKHDLKLTCRGYGNRMLRDTITYDYGIHNETEGDIWTLKDVIDNILLLPDSGYDTGITLDTDAGLIISKYAEEECNFDKTYLLDAVKKIAERINYDGYMDLVDSNLKLVFKASGTVYADPAVTLTHPFVFVRPEFNVDDIKNYWLIWGGIEKGRPSYLDDWTEGAMLKYDPDIWVPDNEDVSIADDAVSYRVGAKSIKITSVGDRTSAHLDISKTEEAPYIDATTRFTQIVLWGEIDTAFNGINVEIEDDASPTPNKIRYANWSTTNKFYFHDKWEEHKIPIGTNTPIENGGLLGSLFKRWYYVTGSSFSWKITKVHFADAAILPVAPLEIEIDGLYFYGGKSIDPLAYPVWNPPVKDDDSIALYDRHLAHYENRSIYNVEMAQQVGTIILNIRKEPHRKIKCKKGAKIWVRPSQVVTLNEPEYEVDSEEWRVLEVETNWKTPTLLRTTFSLVPKTYMVSYKAYLEDTIEGLLKGD